MRLILEIKWNSLEIKSENKKRICLRKEVIKKD